MYALKAVFRRALFFFNDTATTEIYTLSLHDALPIYARPSAAYPRLRMTKSSRMPMTSSRSEEHTSELQSHSDLVCRLLLVKKATITRHFRLGTEQNMPLHTVLHTIEQ